MARRAMNAKPVATDKAPIRSRKELETDQVIFLGEPEIDYFVSELERVWTDADRDIDAALTKVAEAFNTKDKDSSISNIIQYAGGVTTGMFGRFITSDLLARTDAAVHVAHAFTVHASETVDDYFTAVDDIEPNSGAAHLNTTELTSGLFLYSAVIDVDLLVSNLSSVREAAADTVGRFIMLFATACMSAKLGSTAPHSRAQFVMVEMGDVQPRTLAAAFEKPVHSLSGWLEPSVQALRTYMQAEDEMYGTEATERVYCSVLKLPGEAPMIPSATRVPSVLNVAEKARAYVSGDA
jgi:CRISPR system Cascade subunit CasC